MQTQESKEIVIKLTEYRLNNGMSKTELAQYLNIPRYTLIRWENGVNVSPAMVRVLESMGII